MIEFATRRRRTEAEVNFGSIANRALVKNNVKWVAFQNLNFEQLCITTAQ